MKPWPVIAGVSRIGRSGGSGKSAPAGWRLSAVFVAPAVLRFPCAAWFCAPFGAFGPNGTRWQTRPGPFVVTSRRLPCSEAIGTSRPSVGWACIWPKASSVGTRLGSRHPHAARAKDRVRFRSQPFWPLPAAVEVATDDAHRVGELRPETSRVQDPPGHWKSGVLRKRASLLSEKCGCISCS